MNTNVTINRYAFLGLLLGLAAGFSVPVLHADQTEASLPVIELTLSTNQITVGDLVHATLTANLAPGETLIAPRFERDPAIVVHEQSGVITLATGPVKRVAFNATLTSFQVGSHSVLTESLQYRDTQGNLHTLRPPEVTLRVDSVLTDKTDRPADLRDLLSPPQTLVQRLLILLVIILLIAALIGAITWWLTHRTRLGPPLPPPPSPYEIALRALDHLKRQPYLDEGRTEAFYIELSAIIRTYLEGRFDIDAPELTTEEFIRASAASPRLKPDQQAMIQDFLVQADLVKFARFEPDRSVMENALAAAESFLHESGKPIPPGDHAAAQLAGGAS